jgi:CzcA family heavy metal efflux pump
MLNWIVGTSLRLRVAVLALAVVLTIVGARTVRDAPLDVFPEFAPPLVEVQTEAPGLSTPEVESLITLPLESALNGIPWLDAVRSKSVLGLSDIVLWFREGTDLLRARQLVQEALAEAAAGLPAVAKPPVMLAPVSSMSRVLMVGLSSKSLSLLEVSSLARWTVRPRLMAVPGVASVSLWGERPRQLQVLVDPERLRANDVTLQQVLDSAGEASRIGGGGFVDTPNQRLALRHIAPVSSAQDLARTVVDFRGGTPLLLGEIADVVEASPPQIGDGVVNDTLGVLMVVEKHPWANTLDLTRALEAALADLRPGLRGMDVDSSIFRPATFIEEAVSNLRRSMFLGCALVVLVLLAFLGDWRAALISAIAIPLSLLAAALVLQARGGTLNTMVLAGLVIALGEVVDDAIIDVENIVRRLRLNRERPDPQPALLVVLKASLEVRSAVVYGSLIVGLVLLPVFMMQGVAGTFFRPLALAYVLAILASLGVALTLTPALSLLLLPRSRRLGSESPLVRALKRSYSRILPGFVARPRATLLALAGGILLAGAGFLLLQEEFLPEFQERGFVMHFIGKPGASIEAMDRITLRASRELRGIPGVQAFGAHVGRAEGGEEIVGPNFAELWTTVSPEVDYEATLERIRALVESYSGLDRDVFTYLGERIEEVLSGTSGSLVVRIFGPELEGLRGQAQRVAGAMRGIEGVVDLRVEPQVPVPQLELRLRSGELARFGLTPGAVRRAAQTLVQGTKVGEVFEAERVSDVTVWGAASVRADVNALRDLRLDTPSGASVRLGEVADLEVVAAESQIKHENASRRIDVTCNVRGRDLGGVARDIGERVRALEFERGYHPEFLGEYAEREAAARRMAFFAGLTLLGILLILYSDFTSLRVALVLMLSLPFALIGGVAAAYLGGGVLSLGSLVGFITVFGIAARNSIMLVSHYRHLEEVEGVPFGRELILRGAHERLSPILMTALAAALGLVPLVVGGNEPGYEIEYPMALVILGGLVTSTVLSLLLLPALYAAFGRRRVPAS